MSDESVSIPVVEEELKLERKAFDTGLVRVRTVANERTEMVSEPLSRTHVVVDRVPLDREIDALPPMREDGDTIIVPVVEERLVKRLFLVEEVRVSRKASEADVQQPVTLRSQQVIVEREKPDAQSTQKE
jgi:uncharacterized protein (TIGR02271 family)